MMYAVLPVMVFVAVSCQPRSEFERRKRADGADGLAVAIEVRGGAAFFDSRHLAGERSEIVCRLPGDEQLGLFPVSRQCDIACRRAPML